MFESDFFRAEVDRAAFRSYTHDVLPTLRLVKPLQAIHSSGTGRILTLWPLLVAEYFVDLVVQGHKVLPIYRCLVRVVVLAQTI